MIYRDRFWIVYNGEVYNFIELRTELERLGHAFCSCSDTEVVLAAYAEWGPSCFERFRGMWGLVVLDCARNEIVLCRDRLGIKPLYLWEGPGIVGVASEIKQFLQIPGFMARLDTKAAAEHLQTGYEDPDRSFLRDVQPIRAASWLRIRLDPLKITEAQSFWHPEKVQISVTNRDEAARLFANKLSECVRLHLRSDVPVGCALSGGLDSSSIAVLTSRLQDGLGEPLHTFTSTFPGDAADEREYVDAVLENIHTSPHFVTPDPELFLEELDRFVWIHDEPVGGTSMYAGYCVARLTQQAGVSVTLNGQGGDEILSGYWQSYFLHLRELWKQGQMLALMSHFVGALVGKGNPTLVNQIPLMLRRYRARMRPSLRVRLSDTVVTDTARLLNEILALNEQARRVYEMRTMHLPRLLKWDDRNSMAFSVEGRYPFLDHELIELCLSLAPQTLYRQGWTKSPIRIGLKDHLPAKILQRRSKAGFETPQDKWLCGPLRPELESWLESDRPVWEYVEPNDVRCLAKRVWGLNGKHDEPGQALFRIFVFDRWLSLFRIRC
jgi:asparagine synthase (glutamine-hydrolysing)